MQTCMGCRWWADHYGDGTPDDPFVGLCHYPPEKLPTSMAGVANREREPVRGDNATCPCWTAPDTSAGT